MATEQKQKHIETRTIKETLTRWVDNDKVDARESEGWTVVPAKKGLKTKLSNSTLMQKVTERTVEVEVQEDKKKKEKE